MGDRDRQRSRSPLGRRGDAEGTSTASRWRDGKGDRSESEKLSRTIASFGRYPTKRPRGLEVQRGGNEEAILSVKNLIEVWGREQGVTEHEIVESVRAHMFHKEPHSLRFSIAEDEEGEKLIKVHPKRSEPSADGRGKAHAHMDSERGPSTPKRGLTSKQWLSQGPAKKTPPSREQRSELAVVPRLEPLGSAFDCSEIPHSEMMRQVVPPVAAPPPCIAPCIAVAPAAVFPRNAALALMDTEWDHVRRGGFTEAVRCPASCTCVTCRQIRSLAPGSAGEIYARARLLEIPAPCARHATPVTPPDAPPWPPRIAGPPPRSLSLPTPVGRRDPPRPSQPAEADATMAADERADEVSAVDEAAAMGAGSASMDVADDLGMAASGYSSNGVSGAARGCASHPSRMSKEGEEDDRPVEDRDDGSPDPCEAPVVEPPPAVLSSVPLARKMNMSLDDIIFKDEPSQVFDPIS